MGHGSTSLIHVRSSGLVLSRAFTDNHRKKAVQFTWLRPDLLFDYELVRLHH